MLKLEVAVGDQPVAQNDARCDFRTLIPYSFMNRRKAIISSVSTLTVIALGNLDHSKFSLSDWRSFPCQVLPTSLGSVHHLGSGCRAPTGP
jgi:hypothetical protein